MAKMNRKFIIAAAQRDTANAALAKHGFGPNNFAIACGLTARGVATHYAMDISGLDDVELDIIRRALLPLAVERSDRTLNEALASQAITRRLADHAP